VHTIDPRNFAVAFRWCFFVQPLFLLCASLAGHPVGTVLSHPDLLNPAVIWMVPRESSEHQRSLLFRSHSFAAKSRAIRASDANGGGFSIDGPHWSVDRPQKTAALKASP